MCASQDQCIHAFIGQRGQIPPAAASVASLSGSIHPFSTRGTNRGQATGITTASGRISKIRLSKEADRMVAAVPRIPMRPVFDADTAASAVGSTTPMAGTGSSRRIWDATELTVPHAAMISLTPFDSRKRQSCPGIFFDRLGAAGTVGDPAGIPKIHDVLPGKGRQQLPDDRQAAQPRIKNADGPVVHPHSSSARPAR